MHSDGEINPTLRLALAREENERLRRAKALRAAYGINFYRPHAKQHAFHTCDAVSRYLQTGNRFGKSECGIAEDIAWCMGGRVWYRESFDILGTRKVGTSYENYVKEHHVGSRDHTHIRKGIPDYPVKGLLLVVDWDKAKEVFTNETDDPKTKGKLFKLLPKDAIGKVHRSRGGHVELVEIKRPIEFGGGSSTLKIDTIESWKHNKLGGESGDFDFIHVDEPCPKEMYDSYARGLMDRHGRSWFTCTPLDQMWINDNFTPPKGGDTNSVNGLRFRHAKGGDRFIIRGSIYDNPHRNDAGIVEFESGLTREERECRLFGLPLAMAGLVYKEFTYDIHVLADVPSGWDDFHLPPKNYTIRWWWDYHTRLPQAVLFFATDPKGRLFVYDELFSDNLIDPVAKSILNKTADRFVANTEIDPFALVRNPVDDTCIQDTLLDYGLWVEPATKDLSRGIHKVRERLLEREAVGEMPTIFFSPHLAQTLFEFTHYIYDLKKQEPIDDHNHMMENLYRALLNGCPYIPRDEEAPPRRKTAVRFDEDRHGFKTPRNLSLS